MKYYFFNYKMKKLLMYLVLIIAIIFIGSCTFDNVYINREGDDREGKMFLNKFYSDVINTSYQDVDNMESDSLKQLIGADGISKLLKIINKKAGKCKSYVIDDRYIRYQTGANNGTSFNYKLKVTYAKGKIEEIIGFVKQKKSGIKINSYHAYSDLLIH